MLGTIIIDYKTVDGIEKAITLANILYARNRQGEISINIDKNRGFVDIGKKNLS